MADGFFAYWLPRLSRSVTTDQALRFSARSHLKYSQLRFREAGCMKMALNDRCEWREKMNPSRRYWAPIQHALMREAVTRPRRSSPHIMQHCPFRPDFGIPMLSFTSHRHRLLISAILTTYHSMCRQESHSGTTFVPNIAFARACGTHWHIQGAAKAKLTRQQIMASEHVSDWTWKSGQFARIDSNVLLHLVRRATSCTQGS